MCDTNPPVPGAFTRANIAILVLTAATIYGLEEAHKFGLKRLKSAPLYGEIASGPGDDPAINLDQIALLVTRAQEQVAARTAVPNKPSLEDAFSPRQAVAIAAPVEEDYVLPPIPASPIPETPPEDLRKVFVSAFPLDAVASNGAFFNFRFVATGGVIFDGTAPGKEASVLAKLKSVDSKGAWVDVNGEAVRMDISYDKTS